jgi:multidrug efflux pump subunit AcrA (membrane-fusion protein)
VDEDEKQREPVNPVENIGAMMVVINVKAWIALGAVLMVFAAGLFWGFFGTMQIRRELSGVLVKSGTIINIYAGEDGTLLDFIPEQGMFVEQDQTLARIGQDELVEEVNRLLDTGAAPEFVAEKRALLFRKTQITTWESGRVVDVYAHRGDFVRRGQRLATISKEPPNSRALECLLYVPVEQMRDIKKGQQISVYPAAVSRRTYGNMLGTVAVISDYPVTYQYLTDRLGSEDMARFFLRNSACYEIYVTLVTSEKTATGYEWTTSMGPSQAFGDLTVCTVSAVFDELRPIVVFFLGW